MTFKSKTIESFNPLSIASSIQGSGFGSALFMYSLGFNPLSIASSIQGKSKVWTAPAVGLFQSAINRVFDSRLWDVAALPALVVGFQSAINRVFDSRTI